ncbi:MAG: hypothetical protein ACREQY_12000, partial [Candidatus Binatia bacterium]
RTHRAEAPEGTPRPSGRLFSLPVATCRARPAPGALEKDVGEVAKPAKGGFLVLACFLHHADDPAPVAPVDSDDVRFGNWHERLPQGPP